MITISAFKWVPDFARGQVRDLRARWGWGEAHSQPLVPLNSLQQALQDRLNTEPSGAIEVEELSVALEK